MLTTSVLRWFLIASAVATACASLPACSKSESEASGVTAEDVPDQDQGTITEQHDAGTVVWSVAPDGKARVLVKTPDGKPAQSSSGTLVIKATSDSNAAPTTVVLEPDKARGVLVATIPPLDDDLTEVKYELQVEGKPVTGVLHLPRGGTRELVDDAKVSADVKVTAETKGPNGGIVQVVGKDVVEIVADKSSGKIRVYVLDVNLKPVPIGDRKIKLAFVTAQGPDVIVLTGEPGGKFFVGKMRVLVNPARITIALTTGRHSDVVIYGYHPGAVILIGPRAPTFSVLVNVGWGLDVAIVNPTPVIVVDDHRHWKGKGRGYGRGKNNVHIHIH